MRLHKRTAKALITGISSLLLLPTQSQAQTTNPNAPRLMIWINSDKGYNGLQKVGDAFAKVSSLALFVMPSLAAPDAARSRCS